MNSYLVLVCEPLPCYPFQPHRRSCIISNHIPRTRITACVGEPLLSRCHLPLPVYLSFLAWPALVFCEFFSFLTLNVSPWRLYVPRQKFCPSVRQVHVCIVSNIPIQYVPSMGQNMLCLALDLFDAHCFTDLPPVVYCRSFKILFCTWYWTPSQLLHPDLFSDPHSDFRSLHSQLSVSAAAMNRAILNQVWILPGYPFGACFGAYFCCHLLIYLNHFMTI